MPGRSKGERQFGQIQEEIESRRQRCKEQNAADHPRRIASGVSGGRKSFKSKKYIKGSLNYIF